MNKQYHNSIMASIDGLSHEDIEQQYNIEIYESGEVYDPLSDQVFSSIEDWADYEDSAVEDSESVVFEKIQKRQYNDEY